MRLRKDLLGQRFGRLFVLTSAKSHKTPGGSIKTRWLCRCDCGKLSEVRTESLTNGETKSCGCLVSEGSESQRISAPSHGHTSGSLASRTYATWRAMVGRCKNPNHKDFPRYGGAGIVVCDRWLTFSNFLDDMGERPAGTTLDRFPDKCGPYNKDNCRWATPAEQSRNQSSTKLTAEKAEAIRGDTRPQWKIALDYGISRSAVSNIKRGKLWKKTS